MLGEKCATNTLTSAVTIAILSTVLLAITLPIYRREQWHLAKVV